MELHSSLKHMDQNMERHTSNECGTLYILEHGTPQIRGKWWSSTDQREKARTPHTSRIWNGVDPRNMERHRFEKRYTV